MSVEIQRVEDGQLRHYVVGREHDTDEPLTETVNVAGTDHPRTGHPTEVFDADEATDVFFHYFHDSGTVPDGYVLRYPRPVVGTATGKKLGSSCEGTEAHDGGGTGGIPPINAPPHGRDRCPDRCGDGAFTPAARVKLSQLEQVTWHRIAPGQTSTAPLKGKRDRGARPFPNAAPRARARDLASDRDACSTIRPCADSR